MTPKPRPGVENVLNCILDAEQNLLRAINSQGAEEIIQSGTFRRRYDRLWCEGKIDGPEMVEFFQDLANGSIVRPDGIGRFHHENDWVSPGVASARDGL